MRAADRQRWRRPARGVDSLRTISELSWRYRDPALAVAERLGRAPPPASTRYGRQLRQTSPWPGPPPRSRPASRRRRSSAGARPSAPARRHARRGRRAAVDRAGRRRARARAARPRPPADQHGRDATAGVMLPVQVYPMFEVALRAPARPERRRAPSAHRPRCGPAFTDVAATNPDAWIQQSFTADELAEPTRRKPHDRVPVHEAPELQQPGRPGLGPPPVLGRSGRAGRRPDGPLGVPPRRHRGPRPLARLEPGRPLLLARPPPRRTRRLRPGRASTWTTSPTSTSTPASRPRCRSGRSSWAWCPTRPPTAPAGARSVHPSAHRHRRHELRRRPVQRLHEPRHRHHGRRAPRRPGRRRAVHRQRRLHDRARGAAPLHRSAARRRATATPSRRPRSTPCPGSSSTTDGSDRSRSRASPSPTTATGPTHALLAARSPAGHRTWCRSEEPALLVAAQEEELVGREGRRRADGTVELD